MQWLYLAEEGSPIDQRAGRGIFHGSAHDRPSFADHAQHPCGPFCRNDYVILDHRDGFTRRLSKGDGAHLGDRRALLYRQHAGPRKEPSHQVAGVDPIDNQRFEFDLFPLPLERLETACDIDQRVHGWDDHRELHRCECIVASPFMRIAVIGCGVIGRLRARTVSDNPATRLVGVADVDRGSAAALATQLSTASFADYRQMIDELRPQAVIVSSPVTLHEQMCLHALDRGCHVLVEKPLSNSIESCRRIMERAKEQGLSLGVGFNHRFYPAIQYLVQMLRDGTIGAIDHLRIYGGHDGINNFRADWMYKSELSGGGCMMDVGIHMTDLARFIAGEIRSVYGVSSGSIWKVPGSEDNAMAIFHTDSGVPIIYQASWIEWRGFHWHVDVYGALGMIRAAYAPMFNLLVKHERPGGKRQKTYKIYPAIILREKMKGWTTTTKLTFDDELEHFMRMIQNRPDVELADGWSGFRATEIAQAVYRSTELRAPVTLSEG